MLNFMQIALDEAKKETFDIPVCALIVKNGKIISTALNRREKDKLTTSHAEILAIQEANKKLNSWRLEGCEMYVTLEPCPMCAWAIINSKIEKLFFGSYDLNYGAMGSKINLAAVANSKIEIKGGILENECDELLKNYFRNLRNK